MYCSRKSCKDIERECKCSKWKNINELIDGCYAIFLLFKRTIDFIVAFFVLAVIWPILLLLIIFLHFTNKGAGVFFTQERPGKNARIFKAIKFKTMTDKRDSEGNLLPDAERLTKIGKIVRSLSIDELPQLINMY